MITCRNCGVTFSGKFCSNCGQKESVPRFTFRHILEEAFHAFTHADKSFLSFSRQLLLFPGTVSREYIIEEKRKKYFNPFTFFLLITAINLFVEGKVLQLEEKLFHDNNEYAHLFNVYGKLILLAVIPVFAIFPWLLHSRKPRFHYSEYTVLSMMLVSAYNIIDLFVNSFTYAYTYLTHLHLSLTNHLPFLMLAILYVAYANYQFHSHTANRSVIRSIITGICFFAVLFLGQLFLVWSVVNYFQGVGKFSAFGIRINY